MTDVIFSLYEFGTSPLATRNDIKDKVRVTKKYTDKKKGLPKQP